MKDKKTKPKKEILEIEGFIDNPIYKKLQCVCSQNPNLILERHPFKTCIHCHAQESLDSIPREPFEHTRPERDKNGNLTGKKVIVIVKKIKIALRDKKTDEILGITF